MREGLADALQLQLELAPLLLGHGCGAVHLLAAQEARVLGELELLEHLAVTDHGAHRLRLLGQLLGLLVRRGLHAELVGVLVVLGVHARHFQRGLQFEVLLGLARRGHRGKVDEARHAGEYTMAQEIALRELGAVAHVLSRLGEVCELVEEARALAWAQARQVLQKVLPLRAVGEDPGQAHAEARHPAHHALSERLEQHLPGEGGLEWVEVHGREARALGARHVRELHHRVLRHACDGHRAPEQRVALPELLDRRLGGREEGGHHLRREQAAEGSALVHLG
mmetsp:Transcript_19191/g.51691  ORF Transcript_19191/g.51691 Transcript_19191/m.51691 type:complete len:281 (-) Transcript_19191:923-1765(-)